MLTYIFFVPSQRGRELEVAGHVARELAGAALTAVVSSSKSPSYVSVVVVSKRSVLVAVSIVANKTIGS